MRKDNLTVEQRRKTMQHIRSKNTKPEQIVAHELKRRHIYFTQHVKVIMGMPDFVFRRKKVAVFIDSDFWHGHPKRFIMPQTNIEYWRSKIARNRKRDKKVNHILKKEGWAVIRLWQYDVENHFDKCIQIILNKLEKRKWSKCKSRNTNKKTGKKLLK